MNDASFAPLGGGTTPYGGVWGDKNSKNRSIDATYPQEYVLT